MLGILGFDKIKSGKIKIYGTECRFNKPADAYANGIGFIPESRREESLFPLMSVKFNLTIKALNQFIHGIRVNFTKEYDITERFIQEMKIKTPSPDAFIQNLSGGNQQKVVLARWLATNPKILILNGPTVGVDIGAKYDIHKLLRELAKQGMAVLVVSDDIAEITALCDRALIMKSGKMTQEFKGENLTDENLYQATI